MLFRVIQFGSGHSKSNPLSEEKGYFMTTFSRLQRSVFGLLAAVLLAMTVVLALPTGEAQAATVTGYKAKGYIFLREPGPFGLGHVGVGYEYRTYYSDGTYRATYVYGGVENPNAIYSVPAGSYNGGWFDEADYNGMMRRCGSTVTPTTSLPPISSAPRPGGKRLLTAKLPTFPDAAICSPTTTV
jgi:hypothetical protein